MTAAGPGVPHDTGPAAADRSPWRPDVPPPSGRRPLSVTRAQVRAAYDALGLDPERYHLTGRVDIRPVSVRVYRVRGDEDGQPIYLRDEDRWDEEELELEVVDG